MVIGTLNGMLLVDLLTWSVVNLSTIFSIFAKSGQFVSGLGSVYFVTSKENFIKKLGILLPKYF